MSIHSSLKTGVAGTQQRSVLSRIERIKDLMRKDLWLKDSQPTGLPKTKVIKLKAKKTKTKEEAQPAAAAGAQPTPAAQATKPDSKKPEPSRKSEAAKDKK